jgi:hypothetical protein
MVADRLGREIPRLAGNVRIEVGRLDRGQLKVAEKRA